MPDDAEVAAIFGRNPKLPRSCVSTIEPFRDLVRDWFDADVQGTTIFSALQRNHGYTGSYSAVRLPAAPEGRARRESDDDPGVRTSGAFETVELFRINVAQGSHEVRLTLS